jgi:hypothetical protein
LIVGLLLGALVLPAACGGDDGPAPAATTAAKVATGPATTQGPKSVIGKTLRRAESRECDSDAKTLAAAVEAYTALNGQAPRSEDELVTGGIIREPSKLYDIGSDGSIVPTPGGLCA